MSSLRPLDQFKNVKFIGRVVSNNDPMQLERVKVRIPEVFDGIEDADLPWCIPDVGRCQGNSSSVAWFGVPVVGAALYVEFQQGDPHYPIYTGGVVSQENKPALATTNYPSRWGFKDAKGNSFYSDTSTGDVDFHHFSGTIIHIKPSGELDITSVAKVEVNVTGTVGLTSSGDVTLTAPNFNINSNVMIAGTISTTGGGGDPGTFTIKGTLSTTEGNIIDQGVVLKTHVHGGVVSGGSNTGVPV